MVQHNVRIHSMSMTQAATIVILIGSVLPRISLILVLSPLYLTGVHIFALRNVFFLTWDHRNSVALLMTPERLANHSGSLFCGGCKSTRADCPELALRAKERTCAQHSSPQSHQ